MDDQTIRLWAKWGDYIFPAFDVSEGHAELHTVFSIATERAAIRCWAFLDCCVPEWIADAMTGKPICRRRVDASGKISYN